LLRLVKPTSPPPRQNDDDTHRDRRPPDPKPDPVKPIPLNDAVAVFKKSLHDDTAPVLVTAATVIGDLSLSADPAVVTG
jgi:hypothetical protein